MEQHSAPTPNPRDATEATDEQRELQDQLEHADGEDPQGPAFQQSRHQVSDET